jgi:hypothetical protein
MKRHHTFFDWLMVGASMVLSEATGPLYQSPVAEL